MYTFTKSAQKSSRRCSTSIFLSKLTLRNERRTMQLSPQFELALLYATQAHCDQTRKGSSVPYVAHVLAVAAIALEYGANETEAIAALLDDVVEDCGGAERLRDIRERFGQAVASIVAGCTDTDQTPKPPWRERK